MNGKVMVARKDGGLTQEQLAQQVGLNHADIIRIERHDWIPPAAIRKALAKALKKTESDLFDEIAVRR